MDASRRLGDPPFSVSTPPIPTEYVGDKIGASMTDSSPEKDEKNEARVVIPVKIGRVGFVEDADVDDSNVPSPAQEEVTVAVDGVETQTWDSWEGVLDFLNQSICYRDAKAMNSDAQSQMKRSVSFAERRFMKLKSAWRRLRAAFTKRGRTRLLPPSAWLSRSRNLVGEIVMSPAVQSLVLVVISVDVSVSLHQLFSGGFFSQIRKKDSEELVLLVIDWVVVSVLAVEVVSRVFFLGAKFTHSLINLMEFCLVPMAIFELITRGESGGGMPVPLLRTLRPILRSVNLLLKAARGLSRVRQFQRQLQLQVSGNRRRWRADGFDLDLCYIAENNSSGDAGSLIAMGRPAIGYETFYCNPLIEVARFFNKYHTNRFLVINVSEKVDYPVEPLLHRLLLFPVQDTSVPKLIDLWDLCQVMREFLSRKGNVVAVHSRIGGGRVGLVTCAYLLYSNAKRQAADAINHFERRLTEANSQETVSGVDCASQQRFIEYFCVCVRELRYVPDPPRKARLKNIKMLGVEPEIASMLSVRCFSHTKGTAVRNTFIPCPERGKSGSSLGVQSKPFEAGDGEVNEEAVVMMMHEDDLMQQAQQEREAGVFDSYVSGCRPQPGNPIYDTADPAHAQRDGFEGMDLLQSEVVVWPVEGVELAGEICFEIHKRLESVDGTDPGTQLLLATWLHTNFLEMSAGSQGAMGAAHEVNAMNNRSVCVTLQRFDLDKGANAPCLRSYGSSFEVQLLFEVDELMEYHWGCDDDREIARVTGRKRLDQEILRLAPPSDDEVSDAYDGGWLSWGVKKLWPSIESALHKVMKEHLENHPINTPMGDIPVHLDCFSLGTETPEFGPIYSSQRSGVRAGLQLDIFVRYKGDANIGIQSGTSKIGVTHIGLNGTLSLLFDPIVHSLPIVGGVHFFFLNPPQLVLQFVGLADPLNHNFLKNIIDSKLKALLVDYLVLPNVLTINWMPEKLATADAIQRQGSMLPTGVLRIVITDLEPITPTDFCGKSTLTKLHCGPPPDSSRYAVVRLGAAEGQQELHLQQKQTTEGCDLLVFDRKQHFTIEVWERETLGKSIMLGTSPVGGSHQMTLEDLLGSRGSQWVALDAAIGGDLGSRVRLRSMLFELHADKKKLPATDGESSATRTSARHPTTATTMTMASMVSMASDASHMSAITSGVEDFQELSSPTYSARPSKSLDGFPEFPLAAGFSNGADTRDDVQLRQTEDSAVALLVVSVIKGRIPLEKGEDAGKYCLRVKVTNMHTDERPFTARDTEFWKYIKLSETTLNTIEELSIAGFPADRIATMLKMDKELVAKVMAYRLNFNVELPQHLCVRVPQKALVEERSLTLEVLRKGFGYMKAKGQVLLNKVRGSNGMKLRSLVNLAEVTEGIADKPEAKSHYDLDVEIRLFALVPHKQNHRRPSR